MTSTPGGESASQPSTANNFPRKLPTGITFSFSAGGWLQMYMFGVCHALQQSGVIDHYNLKILGTGEGSFTTQNSGNESCSSLPQSPVLDASSKQRQQSSQTPTVLLPKNQNGKNNHNNNNNTNDQDDDESSGPRPVRFVGASAGALAACCLAADLDMNDVRDFTLDCGEHMNSKWYHFFFMKDYVEIAIDKFATEIMSRDEETGTQEMQDKFRKTLGIYCTVLPLFKKKKFNEFSCVDDVKEALFASLCAAPMVGFPFRLRSTGELVVDGGIAAFQPKSGKSNVITVSPFYFANADIRPSQFIPMLWAFRPPGKKAHAALFDLGYNDAIDYLVRKQYIAPQNSAFIRKPDPKAPRRGVFAIFRDLVFLLTTYILVRPIAIVVVYMEMVVMASYYFARALISNVFGKGGVTIVDWVETMANLCSPAVFMHMAVSPRIPVNERRLAKRSITFRVFAPIFGQPKIEEDENDLLGKKNQQQQQRKRFAVSTPVGAPTQTQVLFDKFRNLGWSGGNSMFNNNKEDRVTVPTTNNFNSSSSPISLVREPSSSSSAEYVVTSPTKQERRNSSIIVLEQQQEKLNDDDEHHHDADVVVPEKKREVVPPQDETRNDEKTEPVAAATAFTTTTTTNSNNNNKKKKFKKGGGN